MKIKVLVTAATVMTFAACNSPKSNEETVKKLNAQSLECISIMNKSDARKTAAMNEGDNATVAAMQKTIDSAAKENAKIGQQLMALQSK